MKFFQTEISSPPGDDVGALVAQTLHENPAIAAKFARKSVEALNRVIKSAMKSTGYTLFTELKAALKSNSLGLEGIARTGDGIAISDTLKLNRPFASKSRVTRRRADRAPGGKLSKLMQYHVDYGPTNKNLEVGLIPSRRGGKEWADKFAQWQQGGSVDVSRFQNYSPRSMKRYFRELGIPSDGSIPQRPARPVIERFRKSINPTELFRQKLTQRLNR